MGLRFMVCGLWFMVYGLWKKGKVSVRVNKKRGKCVDSMETCLSKRIIHRLLSICAAKFNDKYTEYPCQKKLEYILLIHQQDNWDLLTLMNLIWGIPFKYREGEEILKKQQNCNSTKLLLYG